MRAIHILQKTTTSNFKLAPTTFTITTKKTVVQNSQKPSCSRHHTPRKIQKENLHPVAIAARLYYYLYTQQHEEEEDSPALYLQGKQGGDVGIEEEAPVGCHFFPTSPPTYVRQQYCFVSIGTRTVDSHAHVNSATT